MMEEREERGQRDERHREEGKDVRPRPTTLPNIQSSCTGALWVLALLLTVTFFHNVQGQPPPPPAGFIDFDNLPVTRFSCEGKVIGGYYADVETGCQMFHVCTLGQKDEVQDIKFLCLNGTVFDQETRVCERVDEVDCSKAEQFYDLNLDLYVPHVTTPKPQDSEQDEEDEDYPRPGAKSIQNNKVTPKPVTTTTTTTTTVSPRTRPPQPPSTTKSSNPNSKGFSSFNYYLRTPHSHVASGYNSQLRQSYIINNNHPTSPSVTTGRKVPTGPKTIVYGGNSVSSSTPTSRPSVSQSQGQYGVSATTTSPKRTPPSKTQAPVRVAEPELEEQYPDEYYDDADTDYAVSSSTSGSNQAQSPNPKSYEQQNTKTYQNVHYPSNSKPTVLEYRDGRATVSQRTSSVKNSNENKPQISVAVSSSSAVQQNKKIIQVQAPLPILNNSTEEPYYYDDEDYPDDPLPVIDTNRNQNINTNTKSTISSSTSKSRETGDKNPNSGVPGDSSTTAENIEYYDDNESVNTHDHHFSHVDVPRIPFAKPNVPRVLVTNGKPFLPRLRRQSFHHHLLSSSKNGNLGESPVWKTFFLNPSIDNLSNNSSSSYVNSDYDNYFNSKDKINASSRQSNKYRSNEDTHVNLPAGYYEAKRR